MPIEAGLRTYGGDSAGSTPDHAYTVPVVVELLPSGGLSILDAGCGNGVIAGRLAEMGHHTI